MIFEPVVYGDDRGQFFELWNAAHYRRLGIDGTFVQDNVSYSRRGVLRGLHFQHPNAQGKLVSVLEGAVYDVVLDIRVGSPTFGKWTAVELSSANRLQLYVPPGYAHGFAVTSAQALFHYKCTEFYRREAEGSVRWNDPALTIPWPIADPLLSPKDRDAPLLMELDSASLPPYAG